MDMPRKISRRELLVTTAAVGGGMAISILLPAGVDAAHMDREPWTKGLAKGAHELTPWISILPDDSVIIRTSMPETGNGVMTQGAMTITEELHCDWSKVRVECASMNRDARENKVYSTVGGVVATFGGRSTTPEKLTLLLQVGASARERLIAAAAQRWGVPAPEIQARESVLTHRPTGRKLRYGEVAAQAATIKLAAEPALKPREQWTFLGKANPSKLNNPLIVNGSAIYGIDVRLPGMVYAALKQSPVHGGKLKSYNFDAIKNMPGVIGVAVVDPSEPRKRVKMVFSSIDPAPQSAIAVVAHHYWQARKALEALPVEWEDGPGAKWRTTDQVYQAALAELSRPGEKIERNEGDAPKVLEGHPKVVEATYLTPFCDQATMEPLNGTALVTKDRVDLWHAAAVSAQAYLVAVEESGLAPENVHLHQTFVGGSFGRRLFGDDARMVVAVARKFPGRPVQVIWSREETTRQGRYRGLQATKLSAALDASGMPEALQVRLVQHGADLNGVINSAYANSKSIPNLRMESRALPLHVLTGAYRAPSYNSGAFVMEAFIDECAAAAGVDPLTYRLRLLERWPDPAWKNCLQEVAAKSGWGKTLPKGQAQGLAISNWGGDGKPRAGTTVAAVATVEVTREGELKILQLDLAFDCGQILNRDAVLTELQGGMVFGLNMSLNEELNIENGRIVEGNFDRYPMLRMSEVPKALHVHFGAVSGHERLSEVGEPPVGPIGPAIANAIFRAAGKRIRTMPFRKHDLRWS
jgi:isoquinoline 1-oxidoreductase beta subunit